MHFLYHNFLDGNGAKYAGTERFGPLGGKYGLKVTEKDESRNQVS